MGAPKFIDIPAAWYGDEMMANKDLWIYNLTEIDIAELEHAADSFNNLSLPLGKISKENFPLPKFANFLQKTQNELGKGIGFKLIRGLPVSRYEPKTYSTIFCGIGSHIGSARSQNAAGHLLGHVRDIGSDMNNPTSRIWQTSARLS